MILIQTLTLFVFFGYFGYIALEKPNPYKLNLNDEHEHIFAIHQRCTGSCNKKYCKIKFSCRPHNRTSKLKHLDIYFNDGVKLEAPIFLEIAAFKKFRTEYRQHMFRHKEEMCKLFTIKNHFVLDFFGLNKSDGNMYDACPLSGHRFEFPKYTSPWIPTLVPTGEWRLDFVMNKVIDGVNEHILTVMVYITVKAKDAVGAEEF